MPSDIPQGAQTLAQKFKWLLVVLGILAAGILSMVLLRAFAPQPVQLPAQTSVPLVQTWALQHRDEPLQIRGQGLVRPRAEVTISAQVSGEVISTHAQLKTGGKFSKGEVLLEIDPRPFRAALDDARAALQAQAASLELLERQLERASSLQERDFVDENTLDDLRSRRDQAAANLRRQQASVLTRELDLEHASISAPFDGYILSEDVDAGDVVSPGRELARFYASDSAEVVVALQVGDAAFIPGLWDKPAAARKAVVRAEYGQQIYEWSARLDRVEADLDQATRTIDVVVRIPEPQQPGRPLDSNTATPGISAPPLLVGMYTDVVLEGMQLAGHFVLPVSAVHDGNIWILDDSNRLRVVPVQVVRQEEDNYVLLAPELQEGTPVVTSSLALVSDGMQVQQAGVAP